MMPSDHPAQILMKALVHTYNRIVNGKMVVVKEHLDHRISRQDYLAHEVKKVAAKKEVALPKNMPIIFASGTNDAGEIRGMRDAGIAVGTVANELYNPEALREVEDLAGTGLPVFVDSGAFSEVTEQKDGPPVVTKPIPDSEWKKRLQLYIHLSKKLGGQLNAVAPDQIANQQTTLWRLRQYASEMKQVAQNGSHVLVVLQGGPMDRITFFKRATEAIGFSENVVPCFPMKKAPASKAEIVEFMKVVKPKRVHFLGLGIRGKDTAEILDAAQAASPESQITIDANIISGHVGRAKDGVAASSRTLTAAQDAILNWGYDDPLGEIKNPEWGLHEDFTNAISEPSSWLTDGQLVKIAEAVKLTPDQTKAFVADPDSFLQDESNGEGSIQWYEHPLMVNALENAWGERLDRLHTHARKHEAIPAAFKHHPAHGQFPEAGYTGRTIQQFRKLFGGDDD